MTRPLSNECFIALKGTHFFLLLFLFSSLRCDVQFEEFRISIEEILTLIVAMNI